MCSSSCSYFFGIRISRQKKYAFKLGLALSVLTVFLTEILSSADETINWSWQYWSFCCNSICPATNILGFICILEKCFFTKLQRCFVSSDISCVSVDLRVCRVNCEIGKLLHVLKHWALTLLFLRFYLLKYVCNTPTSMCIHLARIYYNQPTQSTDSGDLKWILNRYLLFLHFAFYIASC